jgi:nitroimidazol reductase NimA-like FMN-containing flavoprotein (pyridoxamine 5'-phosphate oxidase superfamily)
MTGGSSIMRLEPSECLNLLAQAKVGRIALSIGALPVIRPVRFVLSAGHVVFRAAPASQLSKAAADAVVAFQVDHADEDRARGWNVMAHGVCRPVRSPDVQEELRNLPLPAWGPNPDEDIFMRMELTRLSGERVFW